MASQSSQKKTRASAMNTSFSSFNSVAASSSTSSPNFKRIPSVWTISLVVAIFLCIFVSELPGAQAKPAEANFQNWFDREVRSPKPKFIRFGRANGGQKFIRFGRSSPDYGAAEANLDELIDAVEEMYPQQQQQQPQQYIPTLEQSQRWPSLMPKRAQKFIRFG